MNAFLLPREPGCDDDRDDYSDPDPEYLACPELPLDDGEDPDAWRATIDASMPIPVPVRAPAVPGAEPGSAVHGHVTTIPDDYGAGTGPVQVAVVNAQSVQTGHPAPGYDRPFRVTAWELRIARNGASLGHRGPDCWRLARTTGVQPPRWLERAVGELYARRVTSADIAGQIAAWHREHARKRQPGDSPVPWRDRAMVEEEVSPVAVVSPDVAAALPRFRVRAECIEIPGPAAGPGYVYRPPDGGPVRRYPTWSEAARDYAAAGFEGTVERAGR